MKFAQTFDGLAEPASESFPRLLDRVAFGGLLLMTAAAPHSIAVTQIGWLIGMLAWVVRLFISPRPKIRISSIGFALFALFAWSAISAAFSYEPVASIDKLRAVAIFLIFIFALNVLRSRRAVYLVAFVLIGSCMVSVAWTPIQKLIGRGVQLSQLSPTSPLAKLGVRDGDVISRVNGRRVDIPAEVIRLLTAKESSSVDMNRLDAVFRIEVGRASLLVGDAPEVQLGFGEWKRWRGFRAAGFYGHFTTYAEVLQLIGALAFGLFVAALMRGGSLRSIAALGISVVGIGFALLLTVTRASQLAFMISSMSIVVVGASRKFILVSFAIAVAAAGLGLYFLQQQRQVGFFDSKDGSIQWRQMMWRDGVRLLNENPRHLVVGVGMESIKTRWEEWGLFDKGWQPMGHFHSTPLQLAVERGVPALLIWLLVLGLYARILWRGLKRSSTGSDWRSRGILLGCIGSLIGFFASGLVHYNLGDQEVAMVFFIMMAFGVKLSDLPPPNDMLMADSPILAANA